MKTAAADMKAASVAAGDTKKWMQTKLDEVTNRLKIIHAHLIKGKLNNALVNP